LIISLVAFSLPTVFIVAINNNKVQNGVARRVSEKLAETLGNNITTGDVKLSWFNKLIIHDLLVTDEYGDTALFAPEIIGRLNFFAFTSRDIDIRKVIFNRADVRFLQYLKGTNSTSNSLLTTLKQTIRYLTKSGILGYVPLNFTIAGSPTKTS